MSEGVRCNPVAIRQSRARDHPLRMRESVCYNPQVSGNNQCLIPSRWEECRAHTSRAHHIMCHHHHECVRASFPCPHTHGSCCPHPRQRKQPCARPWPSRLRHHTRHNHTLHRCVAAARIIPAVFRPWNPVPGRVRAMSGALYTSCSRKTQPLLLLLIASQNHAPPAACRRIETKPLNPCLDLVGGFEMVFRWMSHAVPDPSSCFVCLESERQFQAMFTCVFHFLYTFQPHTCCCRLSVRWGRCKRPTG